MKKKMLLLALLGALVLPGLQGCFPLVAVSTGTGVSSVVDRRTVGTQTEDEGIEWKALTRANEKIDKRAHLNFTSFNRKVLVTGEVPNAETKNQVTSMVLGIPNVEKVYNETIIGPASSMVDRSNDSYITTKIKSRSLDTESRFNPLQVKVVTEAGTAYLLGMLTQSEANAAIEVTRRTSGVRRVINLFEIVSAEKAKELDRDVANQKNSPPEDEPLR